MRRFDPGEQIDKHGFVHAAASAFSFFALVLHHLYPLL
jgi:hypothetical protein